MVPCRFYIIQTWPCAPPRRREYPNQFPSQLLDKKFLDPLVGWPLVWHMATDRMKTKYRMYQDLVSNLLQETFRRFSFHHFYTKPESGCPTKFGARSASPRCSPSNA